jgi:hypothetical protein
MTQRLRACGAGAVCEGWLIGKHAARQRRGGHRSSLMQRLPPCHAASTGCMPLRATQRLCAARKPRAVPRQKQRCDTQQPKREVCASVFCSVILGCVRCGEPAAEPVGACVAPAVTRGACQPGARKRSKRGGAALSEPRRADHAPPLLTRTPIGSAIKRCAQHCVSHSGESNHASARISAAQVSHLAANLLLLLLRAQQPHAARQPPRAGAQMRACGAGYARGDVLTAAAAAVRPRGSRKRTGVKSFLMLNVLRISSGVLPARADRRRCA